MYLSIKVFIICSFFFFLFISFRHIRGLASTPALPPAVQRLLLLRNPHPTQVAKNSSPGTRNWLQTHTVSWAIPLHRYLHCWKVTLVRLRSRAWDTGTSLILWWEIAQNSWTEGHPHVLLRFNLTDNHPHPPSLCQEAGIKASAAPCSSEVVPAARPSAVQMASWNNEEFDKDTESLFNDSPPQVFIESLCC